MFWAHEPESLLMDPLTTIAKNARRVADQHEDHERALDAEEGAYTELLDSVLRAGAPALLAISSASNMSLDGEVLRGLCLIKGEDEEIWWLEKDELVAYKHGSVKTISVADVLASYDRHAIVEAITQISVAMDRQLRGGKHQATEKIRRRAEQVRALASLARGIS